MPLLCIMGSMRNPHIRGIGNRVRNETGWEAFDIMYQFCTGVLFSVEELLEELKQ